MLELLILLNDVLMLSQYQCKLLQISFSANSVVADIMFVNLFYNDLFTNSLPGTNKL